MKQISWIPFLVILTTNVFGQWVQTSGPSGGGISDFAFAGNRILAASFDFGNGVFASEDNGATWHQSGLQGQMLTKISALGNTVIAATTHNSYNETDEIYRSDDAGVTWSKVLTIDNINGVRSICHFQQRWFLSSQGQNGSLYVSNDDGLTWVQNDPVLFNFSHPFAMVSSDNYLIAGTDINGKPVVARTSDGQSWTFTSSDSVPRVYCGTSYGSTVWLGAEGGVMYSTDGGALWSRPSNKGFQNKQEYVKSMCVSQDTILAVSSLNFVYYSLDRGNSWRRFAGSGLPSNASSFFAIALRNGTYYLGASSGILALSNVGSQWQYNTTGLLAASVSALASTDGKIFAITERGVSFTSDAGISWHDPQGPLDLNDTYLIGFAAQQNALYVYGDGLYQWKDQSWSVVDDAPITGLAQSSSGRLFSTRQSDDPIAGRSGMFYSDNGGSTWDSLLTFANSFDTEYYFSKGCMMAHGTTVIAAQTSVAFQNFTDTYFLYVSVDNGLSWRQGLLNKAPSFIYYADGAWYIGTYGGGLLRSVDDGASWALVPAIRSEADVTSLVKTGSWLFASVTGNGSMNDGIYGSGDDGNSWHVAGDANYNFPGPLTSDGTRLHDGGPSVWERKLSELDVNVHQEPHNFAELETFPNPSTSIVNFRISAVREVHGALVISDELGRTILRREIGRVENREELDLPVGGLSVGSYNVRLIDKSGYTVASSKFEIVR
ncbi:MAG: hypothetical protein Q8919_05550 [Bacteroidota bacterium]|nr:hypothetical protein [Bacteroidota bacterium]